MTLPLYFQTAGVLWSPGVLRSGQRLVYIGVNLGGMAGVPQGKKQDRVACSLYM